MYLLMMVLDNVSHLNDVLEAWMEAGVKGVTILESTGINRVLRRAQPSSVFVGFGQMFGSGRVGHNTLFAVIDSMEIAEAAVKGTEAVVGSLKNPHTGIIIAMPVAECWGLPEPYADEIEDKG